MKRVLFSLLAVFAVGSLWADEVTVPTVEIPQGGVGIMSVNFEITSDIKYRDFQFDVNLPEDIDFVRNEDNVAQGEKGDACTQYHAVTFGDRVLGFGYQAGITTDKLLLKSGTLVNIQLTTTKDFKNLPQELDATLTGVKVSVDASSEGASAYEVATIPFKIKIVENIVVLDEESTTAPVAVENTKVKVLRTINAGEWSTICLPFAMTAEQVATAFPETTVELANFTGVETINNNIKVKFASVNPVAIEANHPYIIRVSKAVSEFNVDDVDVDPQEAKVTPVRKNSFIGTYIANTILGGTKDSDIDPVLFLSGGMFYASWGTAKMKAFRGYFELNDLYDVLTEDTNAKISIFVDDETTAIDGINANQRVVEGVYDLQGRKVMVKDGDINNLQRGLYIINGKKVAIK